MGRNKIEESKKKIKTCYSVDADLIKKLNDIGIKNKSKLINWLLRNYLFAGGTNA